MKFFKKQNSEGFIALLLVTLIGFLAALFTISTASRTWMQARNVTDFQSATVARFAAVSCINIARHKIFENGSAPYVPDESVPGEYFAGSGQCEIVSTHRQNNKIFLHTSGTKNGLSISLQSELNAETLEISAIQ